MMQRLLRDCCNFNAVLRLALVLCICLSALGAKAKSSSSSGLVNTNVIRTVDLQGLPFAREQVGVVVQNEHSSKVYKTYTVSVPLDKALWLSQLSVHERKSGEELQVTKVPVTEGSLQQLFQVTLRSGGLQPGEKLSLNIDALFVGGLAEPRPKAAKQYDDQVWHWEDHALALSVYPTRKQKTVVKTRGDILRFTKTAGDATMDGRKKVVFGPYTGQEEEEGRRVEVSFRDNAEQVEAMTHRREYFVSHWADDLNVLEHYAIRNSGPEIEGGFNKVEQMLSKHYKRRDNLVKTLLVKVPADARNMYFVDEIGNVSTSDVSKRRRQPSANGGDELFKVLQLQPRYPLAGGWNYTWWHGYSVPLHRYLKVSTATDSTQQQNRHLLRLPFIGSLAATASLENELTLAMANAQNTAVRAYELRVTLPEGAHDIDVQLPATISGEKNLELRPTKYYFDSIGRTVVVITHENIAPELAARHILVSYSYAPSALWMKPLVVAGALFALFMMASIVSRLQYGLAATPETTNKLSAAAKKQGLKKE
ncbi:dolichyl-diphosphooligosaccharide--protein glycosyltransferase subunit 1 [Coemansia aciculifera]|uniref:Dolichyl-diphosphooligosaccharide--protein glycosyltransferase subunit 1 n=1 Tax=Coemansia aciculifera TaxID=417176 RepID=A0ACC1M8I7_9FUNG|nr:dolichyl-diphosphooligosaccharide--protein glycosyltransferase subunit 1 [Coemansia aciculifera]